MTTDRLWLLLEPMLPSIVRAFDAGEPVIEIR